MSGLHLSRCLDLASTTVRCMSTCRDTEKAFERTMSQARMTSTFAPLTQRFQLSAVPTLTEPRLMPFRRVLMEVMHLTSSAGDISPR